MSQFSSWPELLAAHGSDADYRKNTDPEEGPKHYIDIDNYPEFVSDGRITSTLDSLYLLHTPDFIEGNGFLPWATEAAYDSLVKCFLRGDWERAMLVAADLGHYVGDAHMPLHLTRNYNGQYSGNDGIHYRYESNMIGNFEGEISYEGGPIDPVGNVNAYIFDYIYGNYLYVDSVLAADDYAFTIAGDNWSAEYLEALWEKTRSFTLPLMRNASLALTDLIHAAWLEAGKPSMDPTGYPAFSFENDQPGTSVHDVRMEHYPNPFNESIFIRFHLNEPALVSLMIMDASGRLLENLLEEMHPSGETLLEWHSGDLPPGNYYLILKSPHKITTRKMIRVE